MSKSLSTDLNSCVRKGGYEGFLTLVARIIYYSPLVKIPLFAPYMAHL